MRRIVIESPYAGDTPEDVERNETYARKAMLDSLARGEAPFLGHLLYTQVLNDREPEERRAGIQAHVAWSAVADAVVVYTDWGISGGMALGVAAAELAGVPVEYRQIEGTS